MQVRCYVAFLMATAATLAGCAGSGGEDGAPRDGDLPDAPRLAATSTTGVLRGVVVDEAIRPLANATVAARGPAGAERSATTDGNGFFGFADLAPGTWFVTAEKVAFTPAQQSVEVVAAVDDPPVVKLQLVFVPGEAPFYVAIHQEGFIECVVPGANVCFIANFYPCLVQQMAGQPCTGNLTNDNSVFHVFEPIVASQRHPDWTQLEMVWESTQAATDWLNVRVGPRSPDDGSGVDDRSIGAISPSPLLMAINRSVAEDWDLGTTEGLSLETFSGGNDLTCGGLPVMACTGFQVNQRVDYFFHFFYGYTPPEGWQFSVDGAVPQPPQ